MTGSVKLNSAGGGSVTLVTPSTASNLTLTLPSASGTVATAAGTETLTNKTLTAAGGNTVEATSGPTSSQLAGNRNKIINGAMMIDQRNAGASVTPNGDQTYTLDRWVARLTQASKYSVQQVADAPTGFYDAIKVTSLSAYSVGSSDHFGLAQYLEGLNTFDLSWGTASAATVTLSFWVKSSLTGTFGGSVFGFANGYPSYPFSYSISSANTWEYKSVTISGPTSGSFVATNAGNIVVTWGLGTGSSLSGTANTWNYSTLYRAPTGATSVVGTNGATFYITGVQLEKGTVATPFENRLYGAELALCQRYYQNFTSTGVNYSAHGNGCWYSSTYGEFQKQFIVPMRSAPTATVSAGNTFLANGVVALTPSGSPGPGYMTNLSARINVSVSSGATGGYSFILLDSGSGSSSMQFNAEL